MVSPACVRFRFSSAQTGQPSVWRMWRKEVREEEEDDDDDDDDRVFFFFFFF
jgi:hypothetical protein